MEPLIVLLLIAGAAYFVVFRLLFKKVTIFEYEKGLLYSKGRFIRILGAGRHRYFALTKTIQTVDIRLVTVSITGQEILSSDNIALKVSLAVQYEIADPATAVNKIQNYQEALYVELQLVLREILGSAKIDEILEKRNELGKKLFEIAEPKVKQLGLALKSANIKDIVFPGDLKKMFAQVVKAQKEGLAALEKARGETAALRNLANAAQMLEKNPVLMQLRILQTLGESSGNSIVWGVPSQTIPLPAKARESDQSQSPKSKSADDT